jgi:ribose transport system substrate-binding protein
MAFLRVLRVSVAVSAMAAVVVSVGVAGAEAKGHRFGFSQVTLQSPFYVQLRDGAMAAAKADGDELIFLDANGDVSRQNNDIQDLITKKVDVLIIDPVNADAVAPSLAAAKAARIPVITVDRGVNEPVAAYVGRDNKEMGRLVGAAVVAQLKREGRPHAKVVEIQGDAGGAVMMDRRDGFNSVVSASGAKIVEGPYAEYIRANAITAMQDLLQANPDVAVVYAHNDDMGLGALKVLTESGRKDVMVAGVDGLSEALNVMGSGGSYIATALNDPIYLGDVAIQVAEQIASGHAVPQFVNAGTMLVTKSNVASIKHVGLFGQYRPRVLSNLGKSTSSPLATAH